jgi:hypothetical protein
MTQDTGQSPYLHRRFTEYRTNHCKLTRIREYGAEYGDSHREYANTENTGTENTGTVTENEYGDSHREYGDSHRIYCFFTFFDPFGLPPPRTVAPNEC